MNKILKLNNYEDLSFEYIKSILEELSNYDRAEFNDLSELNNGLFNKIVECCISLFSIRKMQNKSFHSFDDLI